MFQPFTGVFRRSWLGGFKHDHFTMTEPMLQHLNFICYAFWEKMNTTGLLFSIQILGSLRKNGHRKFLIVE
jgi:hypothetical protein